MSLIDATVSEAAIFTLLQGWATAMLGIDVIEGFSDTPRPAGPYVTVDVIKATRVRALGCVLTEEDTGAIQPTERRAVEWEWTVSIKAFRTGAIDNARYLINSLENGTVLVDHLHPLQHRRTRRKCDDCRCCCNGSTIDDCCEFISIDNTPENVGAAWERRAKFEVTLFATVQDGYLIDAAETGTATLTEGASGFANTTTYP